MDMMFGSGSPMWTAIPSMGLPYQPIALGNRTIGAPSFGGSVSAAGVGGAFSNGPAFQTQPAIQTPGIATTYAFAPNAAAALIGADASGLTSPAALLAAVAMRRGQPHGPTNDGEVEEFIYDALDLLPGAADVEVRCENGRVTLTGSAQHKRTKRDVGEIAWAIPALQDVQNNVSITSRRRARAANREAEAPAGASGRKQA